MLKLSTAEKERLLTQAHHETLVLLAINLLYQAAVTIEINTLLLCFCSFDLCCSLLDKDNSIEN